MDDDGDYIQYPPARLQARVEACLEAAFPVEPVPDLGVPKDTRFLDSYDIEWAGRLFGGRRWTEVEFEDGIEIDGPFMYLGPEARRYYLPTLAKHALHDYVQTERLIKVLKGPKEGNQTNVRPLMEALSEAQKASLAVVLLMFDQYVVPQMDYEGEFFHDDIQHLVGLLKRGTQASEKIEEREQGQ